MTPKISQNQKLKELYEIKRIKKSIFSFSKKNFKSKYVFVNYKDESCSTTQVDPKTVVEPYSNPKISPPWPLRSNSY